LSLFLLFVGKNQVRLAVDAILLDAGAERKEQVAAWTADKKLVSTYAMSLQQIDNGVVIPPSGWKCSQCDKTDNLWLNLTDGVILCGRKNWDGSGGNNHAVEHYKKTGYPLAVKLGTITADLEAAGDALERILLWQLYVSSSFNSFTCSATMQDYCYVL
jgi:ubiquitin carboxyl-terminal hydrolase 5/13